MLDVYRSCYKFTDAPFRLSPDIRYLYVHPSFANAKAYLEYAISQGEGFIAITGEPGTGKTTLIAGLLAELDRSQVQVATLNNSQMDPGNLVRMVADGFGLKNQSGTKSESLLELEQFLKSQRQKGKRAVLIVDEAQGLTAATLEELRLLSNLQHENNLLMQVFLVGQEEVMDVIHSPGMEHLLQRMIAASHLERLDLHEMVAYVEHRLCQAGWQGIPAIDEDALRLIHRYSRGVPRRVNLICHRLFLFGGLNKKEQFCGDDAKRIIEELCRERVLVCDAEKESDTDTDSEPGLGDSSALSLNLPRAKSPVHFQQNTDSEIQVNNHEPPGEAVSEEPPVLTDRQDSEIDQIPDLSLEENSPESAELVDRRDYPVDRTIEHHPRVFRVKLDRHRALAALLVLLASALLIAPGAKNIREHLAGLLMPTTPDRIAGDANKSLPEALSVATSSAEYKIGAVSNGAEESPAAPVEMAGDIQRDMPSVVPKIQSLSLQMPKSEPDEIASGEKFRENFATTPELAQVQADDQEVRLEPELGEEPEKQNVMVIRQAESSVSEDMVEPIRVTALQSGKERLRLREEAQQRFSERLGRLGASESSKNVSSFSALDTSNAVVVTNKAASTSATVKSTLIEGDWVSQGNPAELLPSRTTKCTREEKQIKCWSTPRIIDTKLGKALYKVETTIAEFSGAEADRFQLSYQTFAKLLEGGNERAVDPAELNWQITQHVMNCSLIQPDWVQCWDEKGSRRDYRRSTLRDRS